MKKSFWLGFFSLCSVVLSAQTYYLHCGRVIDGLSSKVQTEQTIIVKGERIEAIRNGYVAAPSDVVVIDLKNHLVSPGWMDMHVHLESENNPKSYEEGFRNSDADIAFNAAMFARRTLMAGFTTVRDLGGTGVNVSLRNASQAGKIPGPRVYTAEKSIATTGGHADPTNGVRKDLRGDPGPAEGVINGPDDAYKAVRQRYKNGADVIKITATGGVLSVAKDGQGPQFTDEELAAIIAAAKDYGMTTAAHAHGKEGMLRAVKAGITSIEHGSYADEEVMDEMIKMGTYLVPTISAGAFVAEKAKVPGYFPPLVRPKAAEIGPLMQSMTALAYKKGVRIAFGTDSGVSGHGDNAKEFELMQKAGIPVAESIVIATRIPAEMLGLRADLGSLEAGKYADIVAVEGDPLANPALMMKVDFVMKNGHVYKLEGQEQ